MKERERRLEKRENSRSSTFYARGAHMLENRQSNVMNLADIWLEVEESKGEGSPGRRNTTFARVRGSTKKKKEREIQKPKKFTKYELGRKSIYELEVIHGRVEKEVERAS